MPTDPQVIGGGPIGLEFAQMFNRFGVQVVVLERSEQPLPREDRELAVALCAQLSTEGIRLEFGAEMYCGEINKDGKQIHIHRPEGQDEELDQAIREARELLASLQGGGIIQGAGKISDMVNERDRVQAAADDLMCAPREKGMDGVQVARLSGIRELYTALTGDVELQGRLFPERVMLADSDSIVNVLKNAFNKIMVEQWGQLGRAGYRWCGKWQSWMKPSSRRYGICRW